MSEQAQTMLTQALQLSESERAWFAEQLLESLPDVDSPIDDNLLSELERRSEEAIRDPSVLVPWSEVKRTA